MKILISGSTGLIGSELVPCLKDRGNEVVRLVRSEQQMSVDALLWDPEHRELNPEEFEGFDVVINLAGENIATGKWTTEKKNKIYDSRVLGTHILSELLARLETPPKLLINASAVGYYGNRGSKILSEDSLPGKGFLAEVCVKWEEAAEPAAQKGIRVVKFRLGAVLTPKGGALGKMLFPFRIGIGGVIGSGRQYFSWISMDDLLGIFLHVINDESIHGPLNVVSPNPATNREFTKALGRVLKRPTLLPLPAFLIRLILGKEMADSTALSSVRALPEKLKQSGYSFLRPDLKGALKYMLEK